VEVIDQHGNEHRSCPYNPVIYVSNTEIIAYPNPTTPNHSLVIVDVKTDDEDVLANGIITAYNILGQPLGQVRTNGHRSTPVQLPSQVGVYILKFVSGEIQETIKVVVQ
jgi:hypothetical protein